MRLADAKIPLRFLLGLEMNEMKMPQKERMFDPDVRFGENVQRVEEIQDDSREGVDELELAIRKMVDRAEGISDEERAKLLLLVLKYKQIWKLKLGNW